MNSGLYSFKVVCYPFNTSFPKSSLYNTEQFLNNYPTKNLYRIILQQNDKVYGQLNLYINENEAVNALFSGFGGLEHQLSAEGLQQFVDDIINWCHEKGVSDLKLKLPPPFYTGNSELTHHVLLNKGFEVLSDVNQYIVISHMEYKDVIRKNEKKRLRKCKEAGFIFKQLKSDDLPDAYRLVKNNRVRKGFPMTMTYEALEKMYCALPDNYLLFGVFDNDEKLIASSVSIRVTDLVLYNFYHGDDSEYKSFSPIVMILDGIYKYCQENHIAYLDLGISSVNGVLNEGLYKFKENCGAVTTSKKTLIKHLQ